MKNVFKYIGIPTVALGVVVFFIWGQDAMAEKENLSLPAIAELKTGIPGTVVLFETADGEGGIQHRQAEGTNYIRLIPVQLDGRMYTSWVLVLQNCAIPPPGTRVTVEEAILNSRGPAIGRKGTENPGVLTSLECNQPRVSGGGAD